MSKKNLIIIAGPTAVGKTSVAVEIAKKLKTEIVSCDSRQLYKELNIGVAKPDHKELSAVKHHFISQVSILKRYSAGRYEHEAIALINKLFQQYDTLILTGGTGLYIKAITEGLDEFPEVNASDELFYYQLLETAGIEVLQDDLLLKDPVYFKEVDIDNPRRLVRALSVIKSSGKPFSSFRNQESKKRNFDFLAFHLTMDREKLYQRINDRVDQMIQQGLLKEVESLIDYKKMPSLQTVGYTELFKYLDGELTFNQAIDLIKRNSRRYAKRQITWFSNNGNFRKIPSANIDQIMSIINSAINS